MRNDRCGSNRILCRTRRKDVLIRVAGGAFKKPNHLARPGLPHTLRVEFEANRFTVLFNGEKVIKAADDAFDDAGKVDLWTKADSLTLFDDFS